MNFLNPHPFRNKQKECLGNDPFGDGSCVAFYKVDGNTNDEMGNYNGTPSNIIYGDGKFGQAAIFNGSSSRIQISSNPSAPLDFSSGTYSIALWINPSNLNNNNKLIYKWGGSQSSRTMAFTMLTSGYLYIVEGTTGGDVLRTSTTKININTWTFIGLTRKQGGELKMYINNTLTNSFPAQNTYRTSNEPMYIGYQAGQSQNFTGMKDHVRFFNKDISAAEVTTLYNEIPC